MFSRQRKNLKSPEKVSRNEISDLLATFLAISKPTKTITHFTIQFCSKSFSHFRRFNSFSIVKDILPQRSQKLYSLYKFSGKHFPWWCQKRNLHCAIFRPILEVLDICSICSDQVLTIFYSVHWIYLLITFIFIPLCF